MSDVKSAILDAKYIDMVSLADFVVRDLGLPDMDEDGNYLPQANEVAAAIFRWAADFEAGAGAQMPTEISTDAGETDESAGTAEDDHVVDLDIREYDEHGAPIIPVEEAERLDALKNGVAEGA